MNERLKIDALVELRDQYSNVYRLSPTGARGWVRAKREYPKTDPEVYIEWDKNHWRYHGEPDGWTYEHHFRLVDDTLPDVPDMHEILHEAEKKTSGFPPPSKDPQACEHCGEVHGGDEDFLNELLGAQESAIDSDGYFIITLKAVDQGEFTIYQPQLFANTLNSTARAVIEGQIMLIASELFVRDIQDRIQGLEDESGR